MANYCKRLIEVDLPLRRISHNSSFEKNIRQGHISTLHIWWTRKPLGACRAVLCASIWPDPANELCPKEFRISAFRIMKDFARSSQRSKELAELCSSENWRRYSALAELPSDVNLSDPARQLDLRELLLAFIGDFSAWDAAFNQSFIDTAIALTIAAHKTMNNGPQSKPLLLDPFSGSGAIPLEALRIGADAIGSDLNPVALLLNKVILEYLPKYGQILADEVSRWGQWVLNKTKNELLEYYPKDPNGSMPVAYLWARTIMCEGPGCGATIPLVTNLWLATKGSRKVALKAVPDNKRKRIDFEIINDPSPRDVGAGFLRRSSATCPLCGYSTPADRVRNQFLKREGGRNDAQLVAVVTSNPDARGKLYRKPNENDYATVCKCRADLARLTRSTTNDFSMVPHEELPYLRSIFNIQLLGVDEWGKLFTDRQNLALLTFCKQIAEVSKQLEAVDRDLSAAVCSVLALIISKLSDLSNTLCGWEPNVQCVQHLFSRQAMGIIWTFAEGNPVGDSRGSFSVYLNGTVKILKQYSGLWHAGTSYVASATHHPMPDDSANLIVSDPPYYDLVPYADLSDFFYVWLKRMLREIHPALFATDLTPKEDEIVQLAERNPKYAYKSKDNFQRQMTLAMRECRRITTPGGISVIFFAHKGTNAWESQLQAMIDAGWVVTASWPIETELATRMRGMRSAVLGSTIALVCRPREAADGSLCVDAVGDWRDVLGELPGRIHEWMPRLAEEGVVGADAIFACLGPALEIYSRYSSVEKASGESVTLKEYLEHVWAAVAKEALTMIFTGADTSGFEEDARLTAMWLWTLKTGDCNGTDNSDDEYAADEEAEGVKKGKAGGFALEYDAARKIAQGLGAYLESLSSVVEVKGETARLLSVADRAAYLLGGNEDKSNPVRPKKKSQLDLFKGLQVAEETGPTFGETEISRVGDTVLDRIHQSMILFAGGRSEALRRFLVDDGAGTDQRFWTLAQALSALYPGNTDEKRWVDGVLARKKGLGL